MVTYTWDHFLKKKVDYYLLLRGKRTILNHIKYLMSAFEAVTDRTANDNNKKVILRLMNLLLSAFLKQLIFLRF